jgi:two-component system response regulator RegA
MAEKILIIDDDETLTAVLSRAFIRRQFDVTQANDSKSALAVLEQTQFDKCILDLKINAESGLRLLPKLKQRQPQLHIVILTGYSSINTAVEAIKLGATNYLCKPVDVDEILKAFGQTADMGSLISASPPSVNRLEWEHIQKVLGEHQGNISATARALGMHRRTLQRKLLKKPVKQ